jgi:nucleoside-diphosphate-sugar epimerase
MHGVRRLIYTSTSSVVYNGRDLSGVDESLPLTATCPAAYPLTKAAAEREVLAANAPELRTIALRPHLIWGVGDPHLVPRLIERAKAGRLLIVGSGRNRVDLVHVENVTDAQLLAEAALVQCQLIVDKTIRPPDASGKAYFITNGEPVVLWDWINGLLHALGIPPVKKHVSPAAATTHGAAWETLWRILRLRGEPPMTRFIAKELAADHWFDISAARRDLGYAPRVSMAEGLAELIAGLKLRGQGPVDAQLRKE